MSDMNVRESATSIRPADERRFTEGDCHILARAIQKITGWPIRCVDCDGPDAHAWVETPDGKALDVMGVSTHRKLAFQYGGVRRHNVFDWKTLRRHFGGPMIGRYSYQRAREIAPTVVAMFDQAASTEGKGQ